MKRGTPGATRTSAVLRSLRTGFLPLLLIAALCTIATPSTAGSRNRSRDTSDDSSRSRSRDASEDKSRKRSRDASEDKSRSRSRDASSDSSRKRYRSNTKSGYERDRERRDRSDSPYSSPYSRTDSNKRTHSSSRSNSDSSSNRYSNPYSIEGVNGLSLDIDELEEEEYVNPGERTMGRACMYGTNGRVIYQPRGAVCKGAAPPASAQDRSDSTGDPSAEKRAIPKRKRKTGGRGSCIFGPGNKVIYAPAGADCSS